MADAYGGGILRLDDRGRLQLPIVPQVHKNSFLIMTPGLEGCIQVFTDESWRDFVAWFQRLPRFDQRKVKLARVLIGMAHEVYLDAQGRAVIPEELLRHAKAEAQNKDKTNDAKRTVRLVGMLDHWEIWQVDRFKAHTGEVFQDPEQCKAELEALEAASNSANGEA
ncbi:MAG: hypothetical protein HUU60_11175 [Armatimonadetes bacterium]|nr:hypothetical protein [Armatimonadota bacterium]